MLRFLFPSLLSHPRRSLASFPSLLSHPRRSPPDSSTCHRPWLILPLASQSSFRPCPRILTLRTSTFPPYSPYTSPDTPEHRTPRIYGSPLDLPWIFLSSHGHPSPDLSLLLLPLFHLRLRTPASRSPYLTSIFDPLYHH